jgi:hypothetical protein
MAQYGAGEGDNRTHHHDLAPVGMVTAAAELLAGWSVNEG